MRLAMGLIAGFIVGCALPATAEPRATGRVIVGLRAPATPLAVRELSRRLPARILQVSPGGVVLLVLPHKGATLKTIEAASPKIAYVEREIAMCAPVPVDKSEAQSQ